MNLADRIVAVGVGKYNSHYGYYIPGKTHGHMDSEPFTHSWEVAGALMEKCLDAQLSHKGIRVPLERGRFPYEFEWSKYNPTFSHWESLSIAQSDSLPCAINESCVEALEADLNISGQETDISQSSKDE